MGTHVWLTYKIRLYSSYSHFIVQGLRPAPITDFSHSYRNVMEGGKFPAFPNECFHDYLLQHSLILSTVKGKH
jgi:hypothetical protein